MSVSSTYNMYNKYPGRAEEIAFINHRNNMIDRRLTDEYNGSVITDELGQHMPIHNIETDKYTVMTNRRLQGGINPNEMGYYGGPNHNPYSAPKSGYLASDELPTRTYECELRLLNNNLYNPITEELEPNINDQSNLYKNIYRSHVLSLDDESYGMEQPTIPPYSNFHAKSSIRFKSS